LEAGIAPEPEDSSNLGGILKIFQVNQSRIRDNDYGVQNNEIKDDTGTNQRLIHSKFFTFN
jgi:hypothetical protein